MNRIFSIAIILNLLTVPGLAQESPEQNQDGLWALSLERQAKKMTYYFDLNGTLICYESPPDKPIEPYFELQDFYLHPTIISELDIDAATRKSLRDVLVQYEKDREQLPMKIGSPKSESASAKLQLKKDLIELRMKSERRIESILGAKKFRRLRQIQLRWLIHHNGFWQCLTSEAFAREFGLSFDYDKSRIRQQKIIAKDLFKFEAEWRNQAIERLLEGFSENQVQVFKRTWKEFDSSKLTCGLRQIELQLDSNLEEKKFDAKDPFKFQSDWPRCDTDASGRLVIKNFESKEQQKHPTLQRLRVMLASFRAPLFQRDIEMSADQIEAATRIRESYLARKRELNLEFGRKHGIKPHVIGSGENTTLLYPIQDDELVDQFYLQLDKEADEYCKQLMKILLPHQRELLVAVNRNVQIRAQGPLADMLWGDLGKRMQLSDEQKKELRKRADSVREWIQMESRKSYDDAIEKLIALAAPEDQNQLRRLLGETPKNWSPNLYNFSSSLFLHQN